MSECAVDGEECCSPFSIMQLKNAINKSVGDHFATELMKVQDAVKLLNQKTKGIHPIHSYVIYLSSNHSCWYIYVTMSNIIHSYEVFYYVERHICM